MIQAELVLDEAGLLRSCRAEGHAGAGVRGNDIVCAAVSVLARTMARLLSGRKDITVRVSIPERGKFLLEADYTPEGRECLAATGAFLMEGLLSVEEEFPGYCKVIIERRNSYGT